MSFQNHGMRDDEDEPLDPAAERIRRKLGRLLLGSFGVMFLGLMAVFGAILYKVDARSSNAAAPSADSGETVTGRIAVPAGAKVVGTSLDGEHALLQFRNADGSEGILFVDLRSGRVIARHDLAGE